MDIVEFRKTRIEGRARLLAKIIEVFKPLKPVAIHQFGSGTVRYKDEFSDIDLWITFSDDDIKDIIRNLKGIFNKIAPIVIIHHSWSWSPPGGSSNSVIHETEKGLFVVDYYISKYSKTVIPSRSRLLYGVDDIKKGGWLLNKDSEQKSHETNTLKKDVGLLIDLIFISAKIIVRYANNDDFLNTIKTVHRKFRKKYPGKIKRRVIKLDFKTDYKLLSDLYKVSDKPQKRALKKVRNYIKNIEKLYSKKKLTY